MDLPALSSSSDAIEENDDDDLIDIPEISLSPVSKPRYLASTYIITVVSNSSTPTCMRTH